MADQRALQQWPPPATVAPDPDVWRPSDLRPGDLIFCSRDAGPLAKLGRMSDEPWRHVGAVSVDHDGDPAVVENTGTFFGWRKLDDFFASYDTFGAARLGLGARCLDAAIGWMHEQADRNGDRIVYAWDDLVLAGLLACTQKGAFVGRRSQVRAAITAAAKVAKREQERRGLPSITCSAFVQYAFDAAGLECGIQHERWRSAPSAAPDWPPRVGSLDEFFDTDDEALVATFADHSVLDLLTATEQTDRYINSKMHMSGDQMAEIVKVLVAAVAGYSLGRWSANMAHDGRWITPGDLWRSTTVVARGALVP